MQTCSELMWRRGGVGGKRLWEVPLGRAVRRLASYVGVPVRLVDLVDGVGRRDQVAVVQLERWLRARPFIRAYTAAHLIHRRP
jgi:hypothetical protein